MGSQQVGRRPAENGLGQAGGVLLLRGGVVGGVGQGLGRRLEKAAHGHGRGVAENLYVGLGHRVGDLAVDGCYVSHGSLFRRVAAEEDLDAAGRHCLRQRGGILLLRGRVEGGVARGLGIRLEEAAHGLGGGIAQNFHIGLGDGVGDLAVNCGREGHVLWRVVSWMWLDFRTEILLPARH